MEERNQTKKVKERRERKVKRARVTGKGLSSPLSLMRSRVSMGVPVRDSKTSFKLKVVIFLFGKIIINKKKKKKKLKKVRGG